MGERLVAEEVAAQHTTLRRLLQILRLGLFTVVACILLIPTGIGLVGMWAVVHAPCADSSTTPASYSQPYREVSIPSRSGGAYRGFFIPSAAASFRNQAVIIVPPAYNGGRAGMLYEAAPLAASGYNILTYESRICGGKGVLSLGYRDAEDIADAVAFLRDSTHDIQVEPSKLALHGFSSAGAASIMAAARYPEIRAVLAEGGYHNLNYYMGIGQPRDFLEALMQFGISAAYRLSTGDDSSVLDPISVIADIPPRPIFLVYGSNEVSLGGARAKLDVIRAAQPEAMAELWVVPGAGHGGYLNAVGEAEYLRQVLAFYDCALFDACAAWNEIWK